MANPYYIGPQTPQSPQMSQNPVNYLQGIQALGQSYNQGMESAGASDSEQTMGTFNSALQGASAGFSIGGPVGAAVGAGVGIVTNELGKVAGANRAVKGARTDVSAFSEENGMASFNFDEQRRAQAEADNLQKFTEGYSRDDKAKAIVNPVIGLTRLATRGKRRRIRREAAEKQRQIQANIEREQGRFNTANTQNQQALLQRQAYQDRLNNVYNIPMGYF